VTIIESGNENVCESTNLIRRNLPIKLGIPLDRVKVKKSPPRIEATTLWMLVREWSQGNRSYQFPNQGWEGTITPLNRRITCQLSFRCCHAEVISIIDDKRLWFTTTPSSPSRTI
jgi:hypothetical protein